MPTILDTASEGLILADPSDDSLSVSEVLGRLNTTLLPHQAAFCEDQDHRILGLVSGFGAGKTYGLCAKAINVAAANIGFVSALFEPVAPMLRDILVRSMDDLLEQIGLPYDYRVSPLPEYVLKFKEGEHTILLRTMETWNRIRGQNLCAVGFDEVDTTNRRTAEQASRMALARLRSGNTQQFYVATTPEGFGWAWETFERNSAPDKRLIRARTADNPHLPDGFIDSLLANYPEKLIKAYLDGQFVNLNTGAVYDRFNRGTHICEPPSELKDEPLRVGLDFNIQNMSAVIAVRISGCLHVIDEISGAHDTDALAKEIKGRYPFNKVFIYPDASGGNRSTNATRTDIQILESYGFSNQSPKANPPVRDRVAAVQAALENGKGEVRLKVAACCGKTIESLELQCWTEKGDPDKDAGYDHMNDALGYLVWRELNPLHMNAGRGTGIRIY
ncbi:MAG: terminase large subunit domain-containing protein [Luminiphilus sp.]